MGKKAKTFRGSSILKEPCRACNKPQIYGLHLDTADCAYVPAALKACPFCKASEEHLFHNEAGDGGECVSCGQCGASGPAVSLGTIDHKNEIERAWNRRATTPKARHEQ